MPSSFVPNRAEMEELTKSPRGLVGKDLERRAKLVQRGAQTTVGVRTGRLKKSLSVRLAPSARGIEATVGSSVSYALMHHEGTKPHVIMPTRRKALKFVYGGRTTYAASVHHPGTRQNPYLTRWLREAVK
jgi:phage gpG-like protein